MTTPAGVPNLPIGALTVDTLHDRLQDQTAAAMRNRAGEQMPSIFGLSTGGNIASDLSPFGILTNIWAGINSLIANSDPNDIQGPEDLPPLFMDFIENLPVIGQFVQLLEALVGTYGGDDTTLLAIQDLLEPIRLLVDTIGQEIADWLNWLVGTLFNGSTDPLTNIFTTLAGLLDDAGELTTWLNSLLTNTWETLLTTLETLFGGFDLETFLQPLFAFLSWAWNGVAGGFAGFGSTVDTVLKPIFEWLHWLFGTLFAGSTQTLTNIFTALHGLLDVNGTLTTWINSIPLIGPLVKAITGAVGTLDDLVEHFQQVPIIKELVSILTGKTELDGVALDLTTLGNWANDVLTKFTQIPANNLIGSIPQALLSSIPLSNINFTTPNLLAQGDFGTATTIDAASGWTWDSTTQYPDGALSGSAKVTCNSTTRTLYSNQVIRVAAGDKLNFSAYVKSSGTFSGSGSSIVIGLVPFAGTTQQSAVPFASRGSTSSAWAQMAGAGSYAPWTVPSGVTSVRPYLQITSGATAGSVNFDTISLTKSGLLNGDWMNGVMGTVVSDFQHIADSIILAIKGTGVGSGQAFNTILGSFQSIFTTLFGPFMPSLPTNLVSNPLLQTAIPGLHANKITDGTFGSDFIAENAIGTLQIAPDAVGTSELGPGAVTTNELGPKAVGTTEIKDGAVTGTQTSGLDGSKITDGTVSIDHLPADLKYGIGSGSVSKRTLTDAYPVIEGRNLVGGSYFNSVATTTTDIARVVLSGSPGGLVAYKAINAGWYEVDICYALQSPNNASSTTTYTYNWSVAPALFTGSSATTMTCAAIGQDSNHFAWLYDNFTGTRYGWGDRFAKSSFIVYLTANTYVGAGYDAYLSGQSSPTIFKSDGTGFDSYFSISLLNRSLV